MTKPTNSPLPGPVVATSYEAALAELAVHFTNHEDRHVEAATVHALLAIADQLRLANLLDLACQAPDELADVDYNSAPEEAIATLYTTRAIPGPYSYDNPCDDYTVAELTADAANLLGIHRHTEDQA